MSQLCLEGEIWRIYLFLNLRTTQIVPLFVPQASTLIQKMLSFFTGRRAEFVDPRIVSMTHGREGNIIYQIVLVKIIYLI